MIRWSWIIWQCLGSLVSNLQLWTCRRRALFLFCSQAPGSRLHTTCRRRSCSSSCSWSLCSYWMSRFCAQFRGAPARGRSGWWRPQRRAPVRWWTRQWPASRWGRGGWVQGPTGGARPHAELDPAAEQQDLGQKSRMRRAVEKAQARSAQGACAPAVALGAVAVAGVARGLPCWAGSTRRWARWRGARPPVLWCRRWRRRAPAVGTASPAAPPPRPPRETWEEGRGAAGSLQLCSVQAERFSSGGPAWIRGWSWPSPGSCRRPGPCNLCPGGRAPSRREWRDPQARWAPHSRWEPGEGLCLPGPATVAVALWHCWNHQRDPLSPSAGAAGSPSHLPRPQLCRRQLPHPHKMRF